MSVIALVCAARRGAHSAINGNGTYSVNDPRSALVPVAGVPLVVHATRNLLLSGAIDTLIVDVPPRAEVDAALRGHGVPSSGLTELPEDADVVLVHEVTRAFAPAELITRVIEAVRGGARSVVPVLPCSDTVKRLDGSGMVIATPDRADLRVAQTPRGFANRETALRWLAGDPDAGPVTQVAGHPDARAIQSPFDIAAGIT
jgi:2-C-methyl-D-erythritol 4-phosphate cytidylyltransferase